MRRNLGGGAWRPGRRACGAGSARGAGGAGGEGESGEADGRGLAHAKKVYGYDCAICHGAGGDGKGEIASAMKTPIKDFADPSVQARSDGELFYIVQKGMGEMPPEGDRGKDADIWNLVSYVRTFKK